MQRQKRLLAANGVHALPEIPKIALNPHYIVLFESDISVGDSISPFIAESYGADAEITVPHGLSTEVAEALYGLWYCLHLPNTLYQTIDIPVRALKANQMLDLQHHIDFIPHKLFNARDLAMWHDPELEFLALVVYPDGLDSTPNRASELSFLLPAVPFRSCLIAVLRSIGELYMNMRARI